MKKRHIFTPKKRLIFTPRAELDATANLAGLIGLCRNELNPFGPDWFFDQDRWDVTEVCSRRGTGNQRIRFHFANLESAKCRKPQLMAGSFINFAKAYICYGFSLQPTKVISHEILALRVLEAALLEVQMEADPTKTNPETMNRAAQLSQEYYAPSVAHQVGRHLMLIAKFLSENYLTRAPFQWVNPIPKVDVFTKIGKEFDERRQKMEPTDAALAALGKIFFSRKTGRCFR